MGICTNDLRKMIIRPTLELLGEWSQNAENLLIGTAAVESQLGFQLNGDHGNDLGLYRISAQTHTDVWDNFLVNDPDLASRLRGLASQQQFLQSPHNELITNLAYATGVAWMVYKRHKLTPETHLSIHELAQLWLNCYCTRDQNNQTPHKKLADIDDFVRSYRTLVLCENKILAA